MHRLFVTFLALLFATACTTPSEKISKTDDQVNDTVSTDNEDLSNEPTTQPDTDLAGQETNLEIITSQYELLTTELNDMADLYFVVSVQTNDYEGTSEVTWYFDENAGSRYFKETWSMEGNEGTTEYIVKDNTVVAAYIDETAGERTTSTRWCAGTGGLIITYEEDDSDEISEPVPYDFALKCKEELNRYFRILRTIIHEGEIQSDEGNTFTIHLEDDTSDSDEFTSSTEMMIPKKIYGKLKDD